MPHKQQTVFKSSVPDDLLDKPVLNPRYGGMTLREMTERLLTPRKKNRKSQKPPPPDGKVQFPL